MPMTKSQHPRHRRGANSIEFALLMGVFVSVVGAIMDYGWYFYRRSVATTAVIDGCRAGALLPKDFSPDPEARAVDSMATTMSQYGMTCTTGSGDCSLSTAYTDATPTEQLQCTVNLTYSSFTGIIPLPKQILVTSSSILENQDD